MHREKTGDFHGGIGSDHRTLEVEKMNAKAKSMDMQIMKAK